MTVTQTEYATNPPAEFNVTATFIETISVGGVQPETTTSTTAFVPTTIFATPGETITLIPPPLNAEPTAGFIPGPTRALTATEFEIYFLGSSGTMWTTTTIKVLPTATFSYFYPGEIVVAGGAHHGWNSWNTGQKAGLVAGLSLGVLLIAFLLYCLHRTKKVWISHGAHGPNGFERWQNNQHPGYGYYHTPPNLYTGWGLRPWAGAGGVYGGPVVKKDDSK